MPTPKQSKRLGCLGLAGTFTRFQLCCGGRACPRQGGWAYGCASRLCGTSTLPPPPRACCLRRATQGFSGGSGSPPGGLVRFKWMPQQQALGQRRHHESPPCFSLVSSIDSVGHTRTSASEQRASLNPSFADRRTGRRSRAHTHSGSEHARPRRLPARNHSKTCDFGSLSDSQ